MHHGPDPYAQALADLDRLLTDEHRTVVAQLIEAEARYSTLRAVGRSVANVLRTALRNGDVINSSTTAAVAALKQWEQHDQ